MRSAAARAQAARFQAIKGCGLAVSPASSIASGDSGGLARYRGALQHNERPLLRQARRSTCGMTWSYGRVKSHIRVNGESRGRGQGPACVWTFATCVD